MIIDAYHYNLARLSLDVSEFQPEISQYFPKTHPPSGKNCKYPQIKPSTEKKTGTFEKKPTLIRDFLKNQGSKSRPASLPDNHQTTDWLDETARQPPSVWKPISEQPGRIQYGYLQKPKQKQKFQSTIKANSYHNGDEMPIVER